MTADSKGRKRPRDPNQLGKLIVDISVGEVEDRVPTPEEEGKSAARCREAAAGRVFAGGVRGGGRPRLLRHRFAQARRTSGRLLLRIAHEEQ